MWTEGHNKDLLKFENKIADSTENKSNCEIMNQLARMCQKPQTKNIESVRNIENNTKTEAKSISNMANYNNVFNSD